jgi:hypothetical protein
MMYLWQCWHRALAAVEEDVEEENEALQQCWPQELVVVDNGVSEESL